MPHPVAFLRFAGIRWARAYLFALGLVCSLVAEDAKRVSTSDALNQIITKVSPEYPEIAKQIRVSGRVELEATINEEGAVVTVKTLNGNPILAKAAVDALKKWKFKPFKEDGKPVKVASDFTLDFKQ
jgi:protein TonB